MICHSSECFVIYVINTSVINKKKKRRKNYTFKFLPAVVLQQATDCPAHSAGARFLSVEYCQQTGVQICLFDRQNSEGTETLEHVQYVWCFYEEEQAACTSSRFYSWFLVAGK